MKKFMPKLVMILSILVMMPALGQDDKLRTDYFYKAGKKVEITLSEDYVAVRMKGDDKQAIQIQGRQPSFTKDQPIIFKSSNIAIFKLAKRIDQKGYQSLSSGIQSDKAVEQIYRVVMLKTTNAPMVLTSEIVVRFGEKVTAAERKQLEAKLGLSQVRESKVRIGRYVYRVKSGSARDALDIANQLYETGKVSYSHPNFIADTITRTIPNQPVIPNDALFNDQWHLNNTGQGGGTVDADIDAPEAWDFTLGNIATVVAVLDDGIDTDHDDLIPNIVAGGRDFTANPPDNDPRPGAGDNHGTAVSGVVAARGNNAIGVSGSCPRCGLLPIRMLGGSTADHADAFDYAVAQNAAVITNSWGYNIGTAATDDVEDAINNAATNGRGGRGAVVLFAMTNTNTDNCIGATPDISSMNNVIAVSRSTNLDEMGNAGFGVCMDVLAPTRGGTRGITTTDREGNVGYVNGDYYNDFGGTSSATPLTAGIAGLLLTLNNNLTRTQVQQILEQTAEKIQPATANYNADGFSTTHGHGRVNAHRAIVPTVKISITPAEVTKGSPFSIKVTGSAPFGLSTIWWFGQATGIVELDKAHMQAAPGSAPVYTYTWSNITINNTGTFNFGANARDMRYPNPGDGYPHQASEGSGIATAQVKVTGSICPTSRAAEASYLEPHMGSIRHFRDEVIKSGSMGETLVNAYYKAAPDVTAAMDEHQLLVPLFRLAITPVVYSVVYPEIPVVALLLLGLSLARRRRNRKT